MTILYDPHEKPQSGLTQDLADRYAQTLSDPVARRERQKSADVWRVLYATNRSKLSGDSVVQVAYGNEPGQLATGWGEVRLPRDREKGGVKSPLRLAKWLRPETEPVALAKVSESTSTREFFAELNQTLEASSQRDLLLFVHGFNVDFENAVIRTAQIAADLPFNGAVVSYSWPSQGGVKNYGADEGVVAESVEPLAEFLTALIDNVSPATKINIVVHSMGNRAVLGALNTLPVPSRREKPFHNIVFAAPDVGVSDFRRQVATAIEMADRVTLYVCDGDLALNASRQLHRDAADVTQRIRRAGDATEPFLEEGVETIDVSSVDTSFMGHSYYGSNHDVLADLFSILKEDLPARERTWLKPVKREGSQYWVFDRKPPEIRRVGR